MGGESSVAEGCQGGGETPRRGCFRAARNTSQQHCKQSRFVVSDHPTSNDSWVPDCQHCKQSEMCFDGPCVEPSLVDVLCVFRAHAARDPFHMIIASAIAPSERNAFSSIKCRNDSCVVLCVLLLP